ncbi:MAG: glycosyltransferase family 2 protein [Alphaproteobacteria bacterium]|nr:glycosyltransferase family 2 protein [Alphaproteobacteria bacterium]
MTDHVLIAIPTYKRPRSLARLLDAIARLEDRRGIAQVRNRLVAEALKSDAQFLAMIDDDEWPEPGWIREFLEAQRITGADVLQGSILFAHKGDRPKPVPDIRHATGPVEILEGAGNLLIRRPVLEKTASPWFDPAFALTGGEDLDFFVRLKRAGWRFGWADKARALGEVPAVRDDLRWVLRRASHPRLKPESPAPPARSFRPGGGQTHGDGGPALQRICRGPWRMTVLP